MKHEPGKDNQIHARRKARIQSENEVLYYEVSRRPKNRHKRLSVTKGTSLRTPSGASVPPAWTSIWITTDAKSRIQATGLDSKGRRVYLYSAEYMGRATAAKFTRLKEFSRVYPSLVKKVARDMKNSEEAAVLHLIAKTGFRIGSNSETLARVKAFGASTLRCSHVSIEGNKLSFDFTGKKGVRVSKVVRDSYLAGDISQRCGGGADKNIFDTTDEKIRAYLNSIPRGSGFMVKDFRTYLATMTALRLIKSMPLPENSAQFKKYRKAVGEAVARTLGNSSTIALKSYISPEVFGAWECGHASVVNKTERERFPLEGEFLECVHYDRAVPMEETTDSEPSE